MSEPKNPHAFAKQTPAQTMRMAIALIELNHPVSSFQRDTVAGFLVENGICNSMDHGRAQVKFMVKKMAQKTSKN